MDYDSPITPGAQCSNCKNVRPVNVGQLVFCLVYHWYNNNDQAERCINYCPAWKEKNDHSLPRPRPTR